MQQTTASPSPKKKKKRKRNRQLLLPYIPWHHCCDRPSFVVLDKLSKYCQDGRSWKKHSKIHDDGHNDYDHSFILIMEVFGINFKLTPSTTVKGYSGQDTHLDFAKFIISCAGVLKVITIYYEPARLYMKKGGKKTLRGNSYALKIEPHYDYDPSLHPNNGSFWNQFDIDCFNDGVGGVDSGQGTHLDFAKFIISCAGVLKVMTIYYEPAKEKRWEENTQTQPHNMQQCFFLAIRNLCRSYGLLSD